MPTEHVPHEAGYRPPDELYEIRVYERLAQTLPETIQRMIETQRDFAAAKPEAAAIIESIRDEIEDRFPGREVGEPREWAPDHEAAIEFLRGVDPHSLQEKVHREWRAGDDTLLTAFIALHTARSHLLLEPMRSAHQRSVQSGRLQDAPSLEVVEETEQAKAQDEAILASILEHSQQFRKQYSADDLRSWIQQRERGTRGLAARRRERQRAKGEQPVAPGLADEYGVFDRILAGNFQKTDREHLRAIVDRELATDTHLTESLLADTLRDEEGMRELLVRELQSVLELYQIRRFVDEVIPLRE